MHKASNFLKSQYSIFYQSGLPGRDKKSWRLNGAGRGIRPLFGRGGDWAGRAGLLLGVLADGALQAFNDGRDVFLGIGPKIALHHEAVADVTLGLVHPGIFDYQEDIFIEGGMGRQAIVDVGRPSDDDDEAAFIQNG